MKTNNSRRLFILQIFISFALLVFAFVYFDPINELDREADLINMLVFGMFLPVTFSGLTILACLLLGLPIRISRIIHTWWLSRPLVQLFVLAIGIILLFLSLNVSFQQSELINQNGEQVLKQFSNVFISLTGWFLTAFALLHIYPSAIGEYLSHKLLGKSDCTKSPDR